MDWIDTVNYGKLNTFLQVYSTSGLGVSGNPVPDFIWIPELRWHQNWEKPSLVLVWCAIVYCSYNDWIKWPLWCYAFAMSCVVRCGGTFIGFKQQEIIFQTLTFHVKGRHQQKKNVSFGHCPNKGGGDKGQFRFWHFPPFLWREMAFVTSEYSIKRLFWLETQDAKQAEFGQKHTNFVWLGSTSECLKKCSVRLP